MRTEQTTGKPERINVLAIDGGGIRGIIPAMVLAEIEKRTRKPICQLFDIIAGTSTGGILALGLTKPKSTGSSEPAFSAAELVDLYEKNGLVIFPSSFFRKVRRFFRAQYPASGIENVLNEYFGDARLAEALTTVIVTSYDIEHGEAFFFRSQRAQDPAYQKDYDFPMKEVARATSAAPTFFAPSAVPKGSKDGYWALIDGGVYANNPAMCAYVEALKVNPEADICVVSLGTGRAESSFAYTKAHDWGLLGWARPLIAITLDGPGDTVRYQLDMLLDTQDYFRFQTQLENVSAAMDNASLDNMDHLKKLAGALIEEQSDRIDQACARLT